MRRDVSAAFERLAAAERSFASSEFICPVVAGQMVTVRVAGIVMSMVVEPQDFEGWGIFKVLDLNHAQFVRHPRMSERSEYMKLYPSVRLVLSGRRGDGWYGRSTGGGRLSIVGDAPVFLADGVQIFDRVRCRYDGGSFWFETRDPAGARQADYLRGALNDMVVPDAVQFTGLEPVSRDLYRELYVLRQAEIAEASRDKTEDRLRDALSHAGAVLAGYRELSDVYTVDYTVDGSRHTSVVDKKNLNVRAAGICLSGGDSAFDLTSLVGVIREGAQTGVIVRVGTNTGNYDGDDDW